MRHKSKMMKGRKNKLVDLNALKICQICLSAENKLAHTSTVMKYNSLDTLLGYKWSDRANMNWICYKCSHTVNSIFSFRELCIMADGILKECHAKKFSKKRECLGFIKQRRETITLCEPSISNTLCLNIATSDNCSDESQVTIVSFPSSTTTVAKNFTEGITFISKNNVKTESEDSIDLFNTSNEKDSRIDDECIKDDSDQDFDSRDIDSTTLSERNDEKGKKMNNLILSMDNRVLNTLRYETDELLEVMKEESTCNEDNLDHNLKCEHCNVDFADPIILSEHYKLCDRNEQKIVTKNELEHLFHNTTSGVKAKRKSQPIKVPRKKKQYTEAELTCQICKKIYPTMRKLKKHAANHSDLKPHTCNECNKSFKQRYQLKAHMCVHTGQKSFVCDQCGRAYTSSNTLRNHKMIHAGIKKFVCKDCGKAFLRSVGLRMHVRTHTGEKPFTCESCGKSFAVERNLVAHRRIHSGERPYECPVCGKRFTESGSVKSHVRLHTGEKPFPCSLCSAAFRTSSDLIAHHMHHTGERPFGCDMCSFRCRKSYNLKKHKLTHNKGKT